MPAREPSPEQNDPKPDEAPMPAPGWAPDPKPIEPAEPGQPEKTPDQSNLSRIAAASRGWANGYAGSWGMVEG